VRRVCTDRAAGATSPPLVWYHFTQDRTGSHPRAQLGRFSGFLQADGYAGYDQLYATNRITEVACWAHFRRKIFDIHTTSPTPRTTDLLTRIGSLYKIEDEIRGTPPDVRRRTRLERAAPAIEALRIALDDALRRLSPKSDVAKAIAYGRKRWIALTRFVEAGRLEIDNNIAERAMRSIAINRKNWLSLDRRLVASAPPRSISSSKPASSTVWSRRPTSPTSSRRSRATGPHRVGMSSCPGIGVGLPSNRSQRQLRARPSSHAYRSSIVPAAAMTRDTRKLR
jgi:hypothetical protein